jgi:hypothetical protein
MLACCSPAGRPAMVVASSSPATRSCSAFLGLDLAKKTNHVSIKSTTVPQDL